MTAKREKNKLFYIHIDQQFVCFLKIEPTVVYTVV